MTQAAVKPSSRGLYMLRFGFVLPPSPCADLENASGVSANVPLSSMMPSSSVVTASPGRLVLVAEDETLADGKVGFVAAAGVVETRGLSLVFVTLKRSDSVVLAVSVAVSVAAEALVTLIPGLVTSGVCETLAADIAGVATEIRIISVMTGHESVTSLANGFSAGILRAQSLSVAITRRQIQSLLRAE